MKYNLFLAAMLIMVIVLTACGAPSSNELESLATSAVGTVSPIAGEALGTASPAIGETLGTASPAIGEALATASPAIGEAIGTSASPAVASTVPVGTRSTAEIPVTGDVLIQASPTDTYGRILMDGERRPVFLYTNDPQNGGTSTCGDEACVAEWPPVITDTTAMAGEGIMENLLGTITRSDGRKQVTYNGWPLYYSDTNSTEAHGDEGAWFLVTPEGTATSQ